MNHYVFLLLFSFLAFNVLEAQPQPNPAANKTVASNPKISSVEIKDANYPEPIKNPKTNLLVFNTNAKIVNGTGEGFYFWNGLKWLPFGKLDLSLVKKMYVDEVTEISTTTARNMIKVEETRRKQVADDQKKQIAANNAAREKERLDKMAAKTIMAEGTSTDEVEDYDDLAGEMEDGFRENMDDLKDKDADDTNLDADFDISEDNGTGEDSDLMNIEEDTDDKELQKEEEKSINDGDPDSDDLVKAHKHSADTVATKAVVKTPNPEVPTGPGALSSADKGQAKKPNGKEVVVAPEKTVENPPIAAKIEANVDVPENKVAETPAPATEKPAPKEETPALVEAKTVVPAEKTVEKVENEVVSVENPILPTENQKKKEDKAGIVAEKPIVTAEKAPKKEESPILANAETQNLIQNEPTNENTNFMLGKNALQGNESGINNTAVGHQALMGNKVGSENTAIGESALQNNISGNRNIGIGYNSLYSNAFASYNTAVGVNTLQNYSYDNSGNVFNAYNTALGYAVLMHTNSTNLETGMENTGVGAEALMANTQGKGNTGIGRLTLRNNTRGNFNTALGYEALSFNTVGVCNTALGNGALKYIITGEYNTAIGNNAGPIQANHALENTTAIGYAAVVDADNQVRIGNNAVKSIGGYVGWTNLSDGRFKQNITEDVKGLDFIMQLRPVTYNLNMNALNAHLYGAQATEMLNNSNLGELISEKAQVRYTGFIAQEVESAAKNTNFNFSGIDAPQNENGHYGLRYAEFTVPLVKAVQEQQKIIEDLQAQIADLQKQNQQFTALAKEVEKLKMQMGMMGMANEPSAK